MSRPETCVGCKFYVYNGIKRGAFAYSQCTRDGAKELAMEERKDGDCGPTAALKEAA